MKMLIQIAMVIYGYEWLKAKGYIKGIKIQADQSPEQIVDVVLNPKQIFTE